MLLVYGLLTEEEDFSHRLLDNSNFLTVKEEQREEQKRKQIITAMSLIRFALILMTEKNKINLSHSPK
jgi:hypothetical protein